MAKEIIIFNKLIKAVSKKDFDQLAESHQANHYVKNFDAWSHFLTMLYAQLSHQESLRSIEMNFNYAVRNEKLKGVSKVKRSTLSDANKRRSADFFKEVCHFLIKNVTRHQKKEIKEIVRLIDSTPIQLTGRGHDWVEKTQRIKGLKLHFLYDPTDALPIYFSITSSRINDIVEGEKIIPMPGMIFIYDRAYYDFEWWNSLTKSGATFVTRSKSTLAYKIIKRNVCLERSCIKSDISIELTSKKSYKHKSPLRLIKVWVEINGKWKLMELITNNFKLSANNIVSLYKKRWDIELFFKWIKQNLRIKKFFGENENAIKIQIIVAIIAYVLVKILQLQALEKMTMRQLITFLKSHLFCKVKEYINRKNDFGPPWALNQPKEYLL